MSTNTNYLAMYQKKPSFGVFSSMQSALPQMYILAGRICQFADVKYVIEVGSSFGASLVNHLNGAIFLGIHRLSSREKEILTEEKTRVIKVDFNQFLELDDDILRAAVVVWPYMDVDFVLHQDMIDKLKRWICIAPYVIISHSPSLEAFDRRSEALKEADKQDATENSFKILLKAVGAEKFMIGKSKAPHDDGPSSFLAVGGTHGVYEPSKTLKVLAIISCFNDADIIENVVHHLLLEGCFVHLIDNWSTDGTWEKITQLAATDAARIVKVERYPTDLKDDQYNWYGILKRKEEIAQTTAFDWFIHYDSDEIRTSCWPKVSIVEALSFIDRLGYNVVNHHVIDFRPTRGGFGPNDDAKAFFTHFEPNQVKANSNQLKAWKSQPVRVDLANSGGHLVSFPERRLYPFCFLLAHYSLRSPEQARRKLYKDRLPRVVKEQTERAYHGHYKRYQTPLWVDHSYIWDAEKLIKFEPGHFTSDFFVSRLAGA